MGSAHTDRIEALVHLSHSASEPEIKTALTRLAAEIKERLEKGSPSSGDFFLSTLRALSKLKGTANAEVRMACLFDCVAYLYSNRFDVEALEAAQLFENLARGHGDKHWLRKAKTLQGIAYAHLGSVAESVLAFSAALSIAREIHDLDGEISIFCNLGIALNYGGLYQEAIPCLQRAALLARDIRLIVPGGPFEAAALCNLAQSYMFLGDYEQGFRAICLCLEKSAEPESSIACFSRAIREFTYVQIAVEVGKLSSAREHAGQCYHYGQKSGSRRSEYLASVARGLCEIHGGTVEKGLALLESAVSISGEEETPEHTAAMCALVRGYEHAGRPEQALERMRRLMTRIRSAREKGLLALVASPQNPMSPSSFVTEQSDLQNLQLREARLRALVAERAAVESRVEMLERFAIASDLKEENSGEHGFRVGRISALLAETLGWMPDALIAIDLAARLHDIGKVAVPDRILLNSTELKEAERHFISAHTTIGAELLAKSNIPQLRMAEEIARYHHEWWNGEGYPSKLKGKRIPIHARIVALADVFDALTHGRPFSKPWPMDQAIEEIKKRKGTQFDPELTEIFLALIERLRNEHDDLDEYLGRAGRNSPFLQARNKIRLMLAEERENEKMATVEGNQTRH